ncbi:hypothetical protein AGLY_000900 [Aphis glycines]|uniref:BRO1 domain-containing protein n=1 Tax=Aphis glycines TaxID=307491 RepID=A0A6G0U8T0_APHGL|nr:hypothetical protein AGLY_000900 [Aphis glycines]
MATTTLLAVPTKRASEVNIVKPLRNLISSHYNSADNPEDYTEAINELSKLRNQALWKVLDKYDNSLELIYTYYDQITSLESKVPPSEVQIPFKWKDAFNKMTSFFANGKVSITLCSFAYERICVLFNIAAQQSAIAAAQNLETDDGLKMAAKFLQQSAGIFNTLKTTVMNVIQQDPTPDLNPDTLAMLSSLMLAQAQEVFIVKANIGDINQQANSYEEINRRITAENKCYFALIPLFKSKLLSRNTKLRLYKVLIRPIVLYACEAWASTKSDEKRLLLFERKILRRIYGPKRNEENTSERRTNAELRIIFNETNIVGILKSRWISWAGYVWRAECQIVHNITLWKPDKKHPRGRPRQRWSDRVRDDLKLMGIRDGERLAKNREVWRDKMKDQTIAKLCAQCEEYYAETAKMMERETVMMSLDKEWTSNVNIL